MRRYFDIFRRNRIKQLWRHARYAWTVKPFWIIILIGVGIIKFPYYFFEIIGIFIVTTIVHMIIVYPFENNFWIDPTKTWAHEDEILREEERKRLQKIEDDFNRWYNEYKAWFATRKPGKEGDSTHDYYVWCIDHLREATSKEQRAYYREQVDGFDEWKYRL